jgi:hypothetical protein
MYNRICIISAKSYSTTIDSVTISIERGDLTSTFSAVIVNSVPNTLTLRSGRISTAILKAAGDIIESEGNNISLLGIVE